MVDITKKLNEIAIPFRFKALYNPQDYGRYDSAVLYFDKQDYEAVNSIMKQLYEDNRDYFHLDIPLFTKQLAPGLGLAEEPNRKFATRETFGMNRCQIIANGLLLAWQEGKTSPEKKLEAIVQQFNSLGIDLQRTYLNAESQDIYRSLSVIS